MTEDDPRFVVRPSRVLPERWVVVDGRTGLLARNHAGRVQAPETKPRAEAWAARLNRNAVCLGCRHRRPAADMVERRCPECLSHS